MPPSSMANKPTKGNRNSKPTKGKKSPALKELDVKSSDIAATKPQRKWNFLMALFAIALGAFLALRGNDSPTAVKKVWRRFVPTSTPDALLVKREDLDSTQAQKRDGVKLTVHQDQDVDTDTEVYTGTAKIKVEESDLQKKKHAGNGDATALPEHVSDETLEDLQGEEDVPDRRRQRQDRWIQKGDTMIGPHNRSKFGFAIDLVHGDVIIVGLPGYNNDTGAVHVYKYNDNDSWSSQQETQIAGTSRKQEFGRSVSLDADENCVGVGGMGRAAVFDIAQQQLVGADHVGEQKTGFGFQVACRSGLLMASVPGSTEGHVETRHVDSAEPIQSVSGLAEGDQAGVGLAVSLDGTTMAVGAPMHAPGGRTKAGHVRILKLNPEKQWLQIGNAIEGPAADDWLGQAVALSSNGNIVAIGAPGHDTTNGNDSGMVNVYQLNGEKWQLMGESLIGDAEMDEFGFSVALSGDGKVRGC